MIPRFFLRWLKLWSSEFKSEYILIRNFDFDLKFHVSRKMLRRWVFSHTLGLCSNWLKAKAKFFLKFTSSIHVGWWYHCQINNGFFRFNVSIHTDRWITLIFTRDKMEWRRLRLAITYLWKWHFPVCLHFHCAKSRLRDWRKSCAITTKYRLPFQRQTLTLW